MKYKPTTASEALKNNDENSLRAIRALAKFYKESNSFKPIIENDMVVAISFHTQFGDIVYEKFEASPVLGESGLQCINWFSDDMNYKFLITTASNGNAYNPAHLSRKIKVINPIHEDSSFHDPSDEYGEEDSFFFFTN